ncbi:PIG-L family deacetylase [Dinghuibacter silviterrae]|uniref:GlcNAc-PI de-N-acetylase n=1 Tax=Dinghuibacter silviterrae TaxID=1539049 RepID=A0A4R8DGG7_9BACT|nr:PIG-L family deacetylase [Dinghuibacter silviterrae]TDW96547.1 GlcNAc-PI de-N-acetylase [Dinghuibacter silviterrae]
MMILRRLLPTIAAISVITSTSAQAPRSYSSADILQLMQQLKVVGSVLYIAAHPDDENTRLLAYLARERKVRTAYMSLTRGDGGQNLLGDEQGIELGLIRTQELLAARRIDGAEQFFSRAYDFGFCKSAQEALKIWGEDSILADVVWVIRKFQPDVIITRFPEDRRAGHGHHAASAILAREAFTAAADPNRFPEQFALGVKPWQAKRILWNTFNFGGNNTTSEDQFKIDVGTYNALLGKSYGEIAAESRSQHKSQGFGVAASRGRSFEYFQTVGGDAPKNDLLDGVTADWSRLGAPEINAAIDSVINSFDPLHPSASMPALERLTGRVAELHTGIWWNYKLDQLHLLENACSGLWTEAFVTRPYLVRGETAPVTVSMVNRGPEPITVTHIMVGTIDTAITATLSPNIPVSFTIPFHVWEGEPLSQPYWLRREKTEGRFSVEDQHDIGKPQNDPPLSAFIWVAQGGDDRRVALPVMYRHTDPVRGELYQPLEIVPALLVYFTPGTILSNLQPVFRPTLKLTVVPTTDIHGASMTVRLAKPGQVMEIDKGTVDLERDKSYQYEIPYNEKFIDRDSVFDVSVQLKEGDHVAGYSAGLKEIDYPHIPFIHYFHGTSTKVIGERVNVKGKHIGYIVGAGDKMPGCLEEMGYDVTILHEADLLDGGLGRFDAIITGVRAFNTQPWLRNVMPGLMDYVKAGGVLLEQYNNLNGLVTPALGPYAFHVGGGRVTDEAADVSFLEPGNAAFHYPNEITPKDFDGWIQERGLYYVDADGLDPHYKALLGMHDPGEAIQKGSLIVGAYGKGKFVYTSLAFFRQLPAGVPGAYRLFANLLAPPPVQ